MLPSVSQDRRYPEISITPALLSRGCGQHLGLVCLRATMFDCLGNEYVLELCYWPPLGDRFDLRHGLGE